MVACGLTGVHVKKLGLVDHALLVLAVEDEGREAGRSGSSFPNLL